MAEHRIHIVEQECLGIWTVLHAGSTAYTVLRYVP